MSQLSGAAAISVVSVYYSLSLDNERKQFCRFLFDRKKCEVFRKRARRRSPQTNLTLMELRRVAIKVRESEMEGV